jgi:hypothetical protein
VRRAVASRDETREREDLGQMFDPNANLANPPDATSQMQDPASAYGSLDRDQRALIAQAYIQRFAGVSDPQAQRYADLNPGFVSPEQLAEMHTYSAQYHPEILSDVLQHPVMTDNLSGFASAELDKWQGGGN